MPDRTLGARPRLAVGVRLAQDPVRDRTVLLAPEEVLVLNDTASAVLLLCDGNRSVSDITQALEASYDDVIVDDVVEILGRLAARRFIDLDDG